MNLIDIFDFHLINLSNSLMWCIIKHPLSLKHLTVTFKNKINVNLVDLNNI